MGNTSGLKKSKAWLKIIFTACIISSCGGSGGGNTPLSVELNLSDAQILYTVEDYTEGSLGGLRKILASGASDSAINSINGGTSTPLLQTPDETFVGADNKIYIVLDVTFEGNVCLFLRIDHSGNSECYGKDTNVSSALFFPGASGGNYYHPETHFDSELNFYFADKDGAGPDELEIPDTVSIKKLSTSGSITKLVEYSSSTTLLKFIVLTNGTVFFTGYVNPTQGPITEEEGEHFLRELLPSGTVEDLTPCTEEPINPVPGEPDFDRESLCNSSTTVSFYSLFPSDFSESYEVYDAETKSNGNIVFAGQRLLDSQYLVGEFNQTTQETLVRATSNYKITHIVVLEE